MIKNLVAKFSAGILSSVSSSYSFVNDHDLKKAATLIIESGIFDYDFYLGQLNESFFTPIEAILHYLRIGAKTNLDPHPLFDTAFYVSNNPDIDFNAYNPLLHFIVEGGKRGLDPHPLFESQFYINNYLDVRQSAINPLVHYIHFGAKEKRSPAFSFDAKRYKKKAQEADLRVYLANYFSIRKLNFLRITQTLTVPKTNAISKQVQQLLERRQNLLIYFLSHGIERGVFPFPSFELLYEIYPPVNGGTTSGIKARSRLNIWKIIPRNSNNYLSLPLKFREFGKQVAKANLSKEKYVLFKKLVQSLTLKTNAKKFLDSKKTIILFSHVASLTGAPLLLMQIVKGLSAKGWECLLFLEREGELEKEFSEFAHVINFQESMGKEIECEQYLSLLFDNLHLKKPKISILNSLETGIYSRAMNKAGIKVVTLVHELVDTYSLTFLRDVFERSQLAIFPAKFVRDFARKKIEKEIDSCPQLIIPNPLLNKEFGDYDRSYGRQLLREEISANKDSYVVLGCGAPELRKGFDLFILAARVVMSSWQQRPEKFLNRPIHFVWVGADSFEWFSPYYYVKWDIKQGDLGSYIHLLPSRKDLRPVFHGADIFVLPSRKDSFPCVIHDAMAAKLPIISFDNAGGVPEMVAGGGAKIIPYGDIVGFAQAIEYYLTNDEERFRDGQINAKLVAEKFRFEDYISKLEKQIENLLT